MRPKIIATQKIARSLTYNEEKVTLGKAECILSANFLRTNLTPEDKLHAFQRRMSLNERVRTSLHITLNFDPSDRLDNKTMTQIASSYMKEIGFEHQPYLVYRHHDAGHPHCHIVTTHVRPNGDPIELYNIGRNQSEQARQKIEKEFGLMTSEKKQQLFLERRQLDNVPRITYGQKSITSSISNVLEYVTQQFKYSSLEEFNSVLRLYNLEAYRGKETSQLYQNRGLLYRVLDENGRYIGVPLKASFFDCKPTLDNLDQQFRYNQSIKQYYDSYLKAVVEYELSKRPTSVDELTERLKQEQVAMLPQRDRSGTITDITYICFYNKCVFKAEELGEKFTIQAIQKGIDRQTELALEQARQQTLKQAQQQALKQAQQQTLKNTPEQPERPRQRLRLSL